MESSTAPPPPAPPFTLRRVRNFWCGSFTAMANPCEILCETPDETQAHSITELAANEALRIERKFSRYRDDSVIHAINTSNGHTLAVDDETAQLLDYSATLWQVSDGAFDITSGVLRHAWRFNEPKQPPSPKTIDELMERVGWLHVRWERPHLTLQCGMELDFGGIGKEYAVDRAMALISAVHHVPTLINFGGDLRTAGPTPHNGAWQVGIESAATTGATENIVKLVTGALATSGDTRRFIEVNGHRYGHILDARTGWPTANAPRSVTVAADTCSQAGVFTTLAMLQGDRAEEFLQNEGVKFWCIR